jgi:hypothetical protein
MGHGTSLSGVLQETTAFFILARYHTRELPRGMLQLSGHIIIKVKLGAVVNSSLG